MERGDLTDDEVIALAKQIEFDRWHAWYFSPEQIEERARIQWERDRS